ncbi:MAG: carbohydrate ABC transporter permease, partial [Pseudomonadota bacterium]
MTAVWQFLTAKAGGKRANWVDYITYAYLLFGVVIILVPVIWIALNSIKSSAQLEKQDLSLLPLEFNRVARATVKGPEGVQIFIIPDLPNWVLNWRELSETEKATQDVNSLLSTLEGNTLYALRSHLGEVPKQARRLIAEKQLPDWLLRYSSMSAEAKNNRDVEAVLSALTAEEIRLLSEYLNIPPYAPSRVISQILVEAPDPDTGEITSFAVANIKPNRPQTTARYADNRSAEVVRLDTNGISASRYLAPALSNYTDPLLGKSRGVQIDLMACLTNSVLVTVIATVLTLLINSMSAFALAKYRFRGQTVFF